MKFLLLFIGLVCYIAGVYLSFTKDLKKEEKGRWLVITGCLLIFANCFYLWYRVNNKIEMGIIIIIIILFIAALYYRHDNSFRYVFGTLVVITLTLCITFWKLPSVMLNNDIIKMGGRHGGNFNVSNIQLVDTVSVYPRVGIMRGGAVLPASIVGNFALENERQTAKLCLYKNNPPYIMIRMNDNSLFIFNFKEPDKTVEFYDKLKNTVNSD